MKAFLAEKGISVNKLGKGATQRYYDEMAKYLDSAEVPARYIEAEL